MYDTFCTEEASRKYILSWNDYKLIALNDMFIQLFEFDFPTEGS